MKFKKKDLTKLPLRHSIVVETIIALIVKCILRYLLMAGYIITCDKFGLYNHGIVANIVVTLTSIYLSRKVLREIGRMICGTEMDDPLFEDIGIIHTVRGIVGLLRRW